MGNGGTTCHTGYASSRALRPAIERVNARLKCIGGERKTRHRGTDRVGWSFLFALAAFNLVRIRTLETAT
jgi:hypothetical protein